MLGMPMFSGVNVTPLGPGRTINLLNLPYPSQNKTMDLTSGISNSSKTPPKSSAYQLDDLEKISLVNA